MVVISEERVEDSVLGVIGNSEYVNVLNRSFMVTGRIAGDQ